MINTYTTPFETWIRLVDDKGFKFFRRFRSDRDSNEIIDEIRALSYLGYIATTADFAQEDYSPFDIKDEDQETPVDFSDLSEETMQRVKNKYRIKS